MTLDPDALRVLEIGRAAGGEPFETGSVAAARTAYNASFPTLQGEHEPVAATQERQIDGTNGPIALRIHRGIGAPQSGAPALLYLHGGGWVVGNLDSHDEICRLMANLGGAVIVCPDYRLAPEHKFPAGLEDCLATLRFIAGNAAGFSASTSDASALPATAPAAISPRCWRCLPAMGLRLSLRRNS